MKRWLNRNKWLFSPLKLIFSYAILIVSIRLIALSLITYFGAYFSIDSQSHFQDINDALSSYEIILVGISSLVFVILLHSLSPQTLPPIVDREYVEKDFLPGFVVGASCAGGLVLAFLLTGFYRYLGFFIQVEEGIYEFIILFFQVLFQISALVIFAYCEEFIFHRHLKTLLRPRLPHWLTAHAIALSFSVIKLIQFDLGILQLSTMYLVSLALYYHSSGERTFARTAGIWAGSLIVFHPLLSLPIFGNEIAGIILIKYHGAAQTMGTPGSAIAGSATAVVTNGNSPSHLAKMATLGTPSLLTRLLTGGAGGPLSSMILQLYLGIDVLRSLWRIRTRRKKGTSKNLANQESNE